MKIRKFKIEDSKEVSRLILNIFKKDNSKGISKEGIDFFIKNHTPQHIKETWPQTYALVVSDNNTIIAVARAKQNGWNTHYFVDKNYRHLGIAKRLDKIMETYHRKIRTKTIKLNSSPYALEFYKKQRYKKRGRKKHYHDIPMYYMEKVLNS